MTQPARGMPDGHQALWTRPRLTLWEVGTKTPLHQKRAGWPRAYDAGYVWD